MSLHGLVQSAERGFNEVRSEVEQLIASGAATAVMNALPTVVAMLDALEGHIHALHGIDQAVHELTDAAGITTPQAQPAQTADQPAQPPTVAFMPDPNATTAPPAQSGIDQPPAPPADPTIGTPTT